MKNIKQRVVRISLLTLLVLSLSPSAHSSPYESEEPLLKDTFITMLNPYIEREVFQYYEGSSQGSRQYGLYDAKIVRMDRNIEGGFSFDVTVQVFTFIGPHNPPYGMETITFHIDPGKVTTLNYEHKEKD